MSRIETPVETFIKFSRAPGWTDSPEEVLAGDLFSMHNESNLFLNPDYYEERQGRLWHHERGQVAGSAVKGDETEEGVIAQLESWFLSHDSGLAVHVSPRREPSGTHPGYPEEQITLYRIGYELTDPKSFKTRKIMFFTSHQFNTDFSNPEEIRRFIFTEDDREISVLAILDWLKKISKKSVQTSLDSVEEGKKWAKYYAGQIISGVPIYAVAEEMEKTGFLGENPIGCGGVTQTGTYLETLTPAPDFDTEGWHGGVCRICGISTWVGPCSICKPCETKL